MQVVSFHRHFFTTTLFLFGAFRIEAAKAFFRVILHFLHISSKSFPHLEVIIEADVESESLKIIEQRNEEYIMLKRVKLSMRNRMNWLLDVVVFGGGILAALSGIYFLFAPSGGYQGGRNPMYGVTIIFSRYTWEDVHLWGGIAMIAAAVIHLLIHWKWIKMTTRRTIRTLFSRERKTPGKVWFNLIINGLVAISFLLTAVSGLYFLFAPSGGFQGGNNAGWDPAFLFSRTTWDLIHTWAGVTFIGAAAVHLWIHWRWIKSVTSRFFLSLLPQSAAAKSAAKVGI
ncbi:MAG: hypothetical protein B6I34_09375 [Anaerolineaceae bacterium 4572_32.1]|nr:MAG: hypothetical protein B6I34_09375 [Anaerolineaceae bacterium 4572_32.1]